MEVAKLFVELIGILIWPAIVLFIVLFFRKQIKDRFHDIKGIKAGGVEISLDREKIEAIVDETVEIKLKTDNEKDKLNQIIFQDSDLKENVIDRDIVTNGRNTMLAFTANQSHNENLKYNIYYDPVDRNHNSPFKYIGLYMEGAIFAIGKLHKIVYCNLENDVLVATNGSNLNNLKEDESKRIKDIIVNTSYYDISNGCKFFLVDKFYKTYYKKSTPYALRGKKYFWLDDVDGFMQGLETEKIADLLKNKEW